MKMFILNPIFDKFETNILWLTSAKKTICIVSKNLYRVFLNILYDELTMALEMVNRNFAQSFTHTHSEPNRGTRERKVIVARRLNNLSLKYRDIWRDLENISKCKLIVNASYIIIFFCYFCSCRWLSL